MTMECSAARHLYGQMVRTCIKEWNQLN